MSAPHLLTPCPSCQQTMGQYRFQGRLHGEIELDLCFSCQGIWFDDFESAQITPGGIIDLFKLIDEHRNEQRQPLRDLLNCPRCHDRLLHGIDLVKAGRFNYHRCLQKHGRFTTFSQFMIEKGFVRQSTVAEVDALKASIGTIRCSGCGAPVDIRKDYACNHCKAPIAILDPDAVKEALANYHQAEIKRTTRDPEKLADALLMRASEERRQKKQPGLLDADIGDLLQSGLENIWRLMQR